ncbi:ABC transporter permease [Acidicapsa acidisoli]|uniref:ABC transporter permease n=1 Tax=Acidicapsa acidisoli TaxID=1615681 RepID=UPI0021E042BE|nr:ABC transporter permease [Acidicapsa acidisoli]
MSVFRRISNLFVRSRVEREIEAELKSHVEMRIEDNVAGGMSPQEARRDALLRFGNRTAIQELVAGEDAALVLENIWRDIRLAFRQLRKSPSFTITAIVTLALGIGANTATFSVVDAVMLRPLPYDHPNQLVDVVSLNRRFPDGEGGSLSYPDYLDMRSGNHTLSNLVSYHDNSYTLTGDGGPVHVDAQVVSWDLLPALGVRPELGRGFAHEDEKAGTRVILISHALWMSQFGGDASVVGRTVRLSGDSFQIIGVMPSSFRFPVTAPKTGMWTTLAVDDVPTDSMFKQRGAHFLNAIGRMKPGVTVAEANQDATAIAANLARQYPKTNIRHDAARVRSELSALVGNTRTALMIVLGAVALVLLIACGNIANLLLARMRERQREIAMRVALGAGRNRIVRQLLIESLTLSAIGGIAGCALAFASTPVMLSLIGDRVPRAADAGVDLRVLAFVAGVSCLSGLIFGIAPAISGSKTDLVSVLKEGGRTEIASRDWLRSGLVVGQVALGLVLASAAGLLITSFLHLRSTDEGFNPSHLLTFLFETPDSRYKETRPQFYREYFEKVRAMHGVDSAAGVMIMPMTDDSADISFEDPEHPAPEGQRAGANVTLITSDYFRTMQIPFLQGRDFSDQDTADSPQVMIVDQAFAQKYFPGENVVGKRLKPGAGNGGEPAWREIVGVVGSVRLSATQREMRPVMYLPSSQLSHWCCLHTVLRTSVEPLSLEPDARQVVASMDKEIPVTDVRTMQDLVFGELAQPRFAMVLLGIFAGLAVLLSVIGLYGVMMYSISRRTREIGIRMALGARRGKVLCGVMREAGVLLAVGVAIGVVASLLSTSVLKTMLYGTGARNPAVLALVTAIAAVTGMIAAFLPARRAASVDPMQALRTD